MYITTRLVQRFAWFAEQSNLHCGYRANSRRRLASSSHRTYNATMVVQIYEVCKSKKKKKQCNFYILKCFLFHFFLSVQVFLLSQVITFANIKMFLSNGPLLYVIVTDKFVITNTWSTCWLTAETNKRKRSRF